MFLHPVIASTGHCSVSRGPSCSLSANVNHWQKALGIFRSRGLSYSDLRQCHTRGTIQYTYTTHIMIFCIVQQLYNQSWNFIGVGNLKHYFTLSLVSVERDGFPRDGVFVFRVLPQFLLALEAPLITQQHRAYSKHCTAHLPTEEVHQIFV